MSVLLQNGAIVNHLTWANTGSIDNKRIGLNWTALMWAAYIGNEEMVTVLLNAKNINPFAKDYDGKTAADISKNRKHNQIANLIYKKMLDSTSAETLLDYGIYFYDKQEYELAIQAFENAVKRGQQPPVINSTAAILSGMPVSSSVSPLEASQLPPASAVPPSLLHFPSAPLR